MFKCLLYFFYSKHSNTNKFLTITFLSFLFNLTANVEMTEDVSSTDITMTDLTADNNYECCICGSTEVAPSATDNLPAQFGLICVVQPSSILGKSVGISRVKFYFLLLYAVKCRMV